MNGISAIVATYKRKTELINLFESIIENKFDQIEVIVVDQNCNNLLDEVILYYNSLLTIKHFKIPIPNQSHARNYGVQKATYDILCFPDDDCWFDPDTLKKVSDQFLNANVDLLIINWKQNIISGGEFSQKINSKQIFSFKAPIHYGTIVMFFRKEVFNQLGGFNETIGLGFYIGGGEDSELLFKAARNKINIFYCTDIIVNHNYIPQDNRDFKSIRSRQRAIGFIFLKQRLPLYVIVRGISSPFLKMLFSFNLSKAKVHYNSFMARLEGIFYALKN